MSRDKKIVLGFTAVSIAIAASRANAATPDAIIDVAQAELPRLAISIAGLAALMYFIK